MLGYYPGVPGMGPPGANGMGPGGWGGGGMLDVGQGTAGGASGGAGFKAGGAGGAGAAKGRNNPDFVVVYTYLAELFDPTVREHHQKLRSMSPIDRETALLLMRNLGANLMCQRMWEDQIQLIGAGCPTFVNPSYDENGLLVGPAGGQGLQESRVGAGSGAGAGEGSSNANRGGDAHDGPGPGGAGGPGGADELNASHSPPHLHPHPLEGGWSSDAYITHDGGNPPEGSQGLGEGEGMGAMGKEDDLGSREDVGDDMHEL
uniref:Uncharacterized protein n=1 Tax=Mantoniella antarctica TaxID=81844 RepID=A0A7S0XCL7_9CHLO